MSASNKTKKPPRNAEPVDSLGETWWLSEVTAGLRKQFCQPIRARARQALIDDRELLDAEDYAAEKAFLQGRIDAGAYDWGPPLDRGGTGPGEAIKAALDTPEGQARLIQLLLVETHDEVPLEKVTEIMAGNPEGIGAALRAAMGLPPLPPPPPEETGEKTETAKTDETTASPAA